MFENCRFFPWRREDWEDINIEKSDFSGITGFAQIHTNGALMFGVENFKILKRQCWSNVSDLDVLI